MRVAFPQLCVLMGKEAGTGSRGGDFLEISKKKKNGSMHQRRPAVNMVIRPALPFYNGLGDNFQALVAVKGTYVTIYF